MKLIFSSKDLLAFANWFLYGKARIPGAWPIEWKTARALTLNHDKVLITDTDDATWSIPTAIFLERFKSDFLISREIYPGEITILGNDLLVEVESLPRVPQRLPNTSYENYRLTPAIPQAPGFPGNWRNLWEKVLKKCGKAFVAPWLKPVNGWR